MYAEKVIPYVYLSMFSSKFSIVAFPMMSCPGAFTVFVCEITHRISMTLVLYELLMWRANKLESVCFHCVVEKRVRRLKVCLKLKLEGVSKKICLLIWVTYLSSWLN